MTTIQNLQLSLQRQVVINQDQLNRITQLEKQLKESQQQTKYEKTQKQMYRENLKELHQKHKIENDDKYTDLKIKICMSKYEAIDDIKYCEWCNDIILPPRTKYCCDEHMKAARSVK